MKYFFLTICVCSVSILFSSCKKNESEANTTNSNSIIGTWELRQAQNGMIPTSEYASGNGAILKFSETAYENYKNGNLIKSGHYMLIRDTTVEAEIGLVIPDGQFINRIVLDNDFASRKTFIEISNNTITFLSGFFPLDGGSRLVYNRIEGDR